MSTTGVWPTATGAQNLWVGDEWDSVNYVEIAAGAKKTAVAMALAGSAALVSLF